MKFRSRMFFVAVPIILFSCSTPKHDVLWVGGIKTECASAERKLECLKIHKGEDLKDEQWEDFSAHIEGFEFEEGYMKKIKVKKEDKNAKDVPAAVKYSLVKELEKKEDPRIYLNGNWLLATINGDSLNKMIVLPTLNFSLSENKISGNGGCNLYAATIDELTSKTIKLKESLGTLMACDNKNIEKEYHTALSEINSYTLQHQVLSFSNKDGEEILSFIKVDKPETNQLLIGEWSTIRINGKQIDVESTPVMVFDLEKMMVGGKDGCNSYNAPIKNVSNTDLLFGTIAATKMMCPDMEVPQQFLEALEQVNTYKIEGKELTLLNKEGKELLAFTK